MVEIMADSQLGALSDAEPNTVSAYSSHRLVGYILRLFFLFSWSTELPEFLKQMGRRPRHL